MWGGLGFLVFGVFLGSGFRVGFVVWFRLFRPDKKDPKCIMGFDSDTFTKNTQTTENLKVGQKK